MSLAVVIAHKEIVDHLRDWRSLLSSAAMALMGPAVVLLVSMSGRAAGGNREGVLLGMLSVFALVTAFAGAVDVAIDSTAGERERRSLLPLFLNPVPARDVVLGKWMAVSVFALGALVLNALGTTIVLAAAAPSLLAARGAQLLLWVSLGLVPLALLGAAASVCVAVLCRTTKEAGTALRILVFLPMVVGMFLVFFPRWAARVWFLPIVGQQALLAIDDAFVQLAGGALLAVVTALAAAVPLAWAVRTLNRDNVWTA